MKQLIAAGLVLALLLLVGCNQQSDEEMATGQVVYEGVSSTLGTGTINEPQVRDYEVRLKGEDEFFPRTFTAATGDTIRLVFLLDQPHFVSIDDYGIAENVQNSIIEFVADKQGTYDLRCWDCEDDPLARIVVE